MNMNMTKVGINNEVTRLISSKDPSHFLSGWEGFLIVGLDVWLISAWQPSPTYNTIYMYMYVQGQPSPT